MRLSDTKFGLGPASTWIGGLIAGLVLFLITVDPAQAQQFSLDLGGEAGPLTSRILQVIVLITVVTLAPSLLVVVTSFTRIVVVLSLLRSAMGVQQTPPNAVLIGLSLFLTAYIMGPTFERAYQEGIVPLLNDEINEPQALERVSRPIHEFMLSQVRDKDLGMFLDLSGAELPENPESTPFVALVPAFLISELKRAFEIGFLLFIPFIIIDMVVASVLMSMGMMMLPPILISLPFKLIFFVLVDGWNLVTNALVQSFG
ncbi:MAG: flagellar type III secretion system pore protein FliP [Proteobacteria bacterium]|nr:flagellar type III secretion system pore protein FliP [Pseudomonadota bacterium]